MLPSIAFRLAFTVATALYLLLGSPLLLMPHRFAMAGLKSHGRTVIGLLRLIAGVSLEVRGRELVPPGALLVASKHQSAFDTFALPMLFDDPALVMKAELMRIPVYGWFARKFGMIPVERDKGPAALRRMLKAARKRAAEGRQILIFPEGTRRPPGASPDYKPGVVALYQTLAVPCVPIALNSGHFWPRGAGRYRPGTIVVQILEPIPPGLERAEFLARLELAIETASAGLLEEAMGAAKRPTSELQRERG